MIKQICYFIVILLQANLFVACNSSNEVSYPKWYLEASNDNDYLYGIGEGESIQEAKAKALEDIATKISLNIESNLEIEKTALDSQVSSKINNNIGISIQDMGLNSIEYTNTEEINNIFFAQARVKKEDLISKFNSDIEEHIIHIKEILNNIKSLGCNTLSPKEKYQLSDLYAKANKISQYINTLNGKVLQKNLLENIKTLLSKPSLAYYVAFAKGGNTSKYQNIDNALMSEYKKFFNLTQKTNGIYHIENIYKFDTKNEALELTLIANIKDCHDNVILNINLKDTNTNATNAINRIKVQLYKKLKKWLDE